MFTRELQELKQRQLALRLRNIELRAAIIVDAQSLSRPTTWLGAAGGMAAAVVLASGLRRPGLVSKLLSLTALGLRLARLFGALRAKP